MRRAATRRGLPRSVVLRWRRLSPAAQTLLAAFVLHPAAVPSRWLNRLARDPAAVDELVTSGWIVEAEDEHWSLSDGKGRAVMRRLVPWSVRQLQHRKLAELCESGGAVDAAAAHWQAAGDNDAAFGAWIRLAVQAAAADGSRSAECLDAAQALMTEATPVTRLEELARAVERCSGDPAVAATLAERVAGWLKQPARGASAVFLGRMAPVLAGLLATRGEHVASAEMRMKAAAALEASGDSAGAARQWTAATLTYVFALQYSAARSTASSALEAARVASDVPVQVEALATLGLLLGMKGETALGRQHLERALDLALAKGLTSAAAEAYRMLGTVAEYASCYRDEQAAFARTLAYCRRHDKRETEALCMGCLSYSFFRSGNWARSRSVVSEVLSRDGAPAVSRLAAEGVLGLLHAHRGEWREAEALLEATNRGADATGILAMRFFGDWGLAMAEEGTGQHAAAALYYRRLLDFWRRTEDRHDAIPGLTTGALFFSDRGDTDAAGEFVAALRVIARDTANPEAEGAVALASGELQRRGGRARAAVTAFQRALSAFEQRELVIERIRVLARLGAAQRMLKKENEAAQAFAEARKRARRLGARALLMMIDACEGAPVKAAPGAAWSGLSPRQRDVARQLQAGLTNKEIAAKLGLSVRTVDMHVAHVLSRLGCRTRAEAAGKLAAVLE